MFCSNCGQPILENAAFCTACGAKILYQEAEMSPDERGEAPAEENRRQADPEQPADRQGYEQAPQDAWQPYQQEAQGGQQQAYRQPDYQQQDYRQQAYQQPNASQGQTDKVAGIVAYLTLIGLIVALVVGDRSDPFTRFHTNQGLVLFIAGIIAAVFAVIPIVGWIIAVILWILIVVGWLVGLISAIQGRMKEAPLFGRIHIIG